MAGFDFSQQMGMVDKSYNASKEVSRIQGEREEALGSTVAGGVASVATASPKAFMNYILSKGSASLEQGIKELREVGELTPELEAAFRQTDVNNPDALKQALVEMAKLKQSYMYDKEAKDFANANMGSADAYEKQLAESELAGVKDLLVAGSTVPDDIAISKMVAQREEDDISKGLTPWSTEKKQAMAEELRSKVDQTVGADASLRRKSTARARLYDALIEKARTDLTRGGLTAFESRFGGASAAKGKGLSFEEMAALENLRQRNRLQGIGARTDAAMTKGAGEAANAFGKEAAKITAKQEENSIKAKQQLTKDNKEIIDMVPKMQSSIKEMKTVASKYVNANGTPPGLGPVGGSDWAAFVRRGTEVAGDASTSAGDLMKTMASKVVDDTNLQAAYGQPITEANRGQAMGAWIADANRMQASTLRFLSDYIKSISGAQVTDVEAERLKKAIGLAWGLGHSTFFNSMNALISSIGEQYGTRQRVAEATYGGNAGKRVYGTDTLVSDWYKEIGFDIDSMKFGDEYLKDVPVTDEQLNFAGDVLSQESAQTGITGNGLANGMLTIVNNVTGGAGGAGGSAQSTTRKPGAVPNNPPPKADGPGMFDPVQ